MNASNSSTDPREILRQRAAALATPIERANVRRVSVGVFTVGPHHLAVPLECFQQVFELHNITAIPCATTSFLGVCVAGGRVVTLVNTGEFFKLRSVVATDMHNGVVISHGERAIAFGARDLLGIEEVEEALMQPVKHESRCMTHAFNDRLLIDPKLVFADPRLAGGPV